MTMTNVKERPIRFSADNARAIVEGRKGQTRRPVKWAGIDPTLNLQWTGIRAEELVAGHPELGYVLRTPTATSWAERTTPTSCPYGKPGDRLWVQEPFYIDLMPHDQGLLPVEAPQDDWRDNIYYRADGECCQQIPECCCGEVGPTPWRSDEELPRWAARTFLEVTGVRVERVQAISYQDVVGEGIVPPTTYWTYCCPPGPGEFAQLHSDETRHLFRTRWDAIYAERGFGWATNCWVWVVEFNRLPVGTETGPPA